MYLSKAHMFMKGNAISRDTVLRVTKTAHNNHLVMHPSIYIYAYNLECVQHLRAV